MQEALASAMTKVNAAENDILPLWAGKHYAQLVEASRLAKLYFEQVQLSSLVVVCVALLLCLQLGLAVKRWTLRIVRGVQISDWNF